MSMEAMVMNKIKASFPLAQFLASKYILNQQILKVQLLSFEGLWNYLALKGIQWRDILQNNQLVLSKSVKVMKDEDW